MKIAYKGTDKNLKCKDQQYEIGKEYYVTNDKKVVEINTIGGEPTFDSSLKTCTNKGIHYCSKLEDCFNYYSNNGDNRFFKVRIKGGYNGDNDGKSITRHIEFLEEITKEKLEAIEQDKKEKALDNSMKIPQTKKLQEKYSNLIIGGSIALYLHGVRLKRFKDGHCDYDITFPHFTLLQSLEDLPIENLEERPSGSDYAETLLIDGVKADIRIDPKQKYSFIKYKDFQYKVVPLETIIEAKAKYAHTQWGVKHKEDLIEMVLNK